MGIIKNPFRKLTSEEKLNRRTSEVFTLLVSETDLELTDLETVQVINNVRRKLNEFLKTKKSDLLEHSTNCSLQADEVQNAIEKIE